MKTKANFDQLAISTSKAANGLFSDLIFAGRFIKTKDDIASAEVREHLVQMLTSCRIRIDSMLKTLE